MTTSTEEKKLTVQITLDEKENFIVENLETGEKTTLEFYWFFGSEFKYESGFQSLFRKIFDGTVEAVLDEAAQNQMHRIIKFNREDC